VAPCAEGTASSLRRHSLRFLALVLLSFLLAACGSSAAKTVHSKTPGAPKQYSAPPKMTIDVNKSYTADIHTTDGTFSVKLEPKSAPIAVNNFIFLARHHFYDGIVFHRIVKGEYIQAGDPSGTGTGGPGYTFKIEKPKRAYTVGTVAMARTDAPNSNGSQFFVIVGPAGTGLTPTFTILGQVVSGRNVTNKIQNTPVGVNPGSGELSDPLRDVTITSITIH
jgi:cyclophilin family peptidyl-prolyl cis-trans isomerase